MRFRSRLVPLFQFAAFYNKDLEIAPGANMTLNGRVHTNGDLYLNASDGVSLDITGQITVGKRSDEPGATGGTLFRRRKNNSDCKGTVRADDIDEDTTEQPAISCSGAKSQSDLDDWNGQIQTDIAHLKVPVDEQFDPAGEYWNKADLRLALNLTETPPSIFVAKPLSDEDRANEDFDYDSYTPEKDILKTAKLTACTSSTPRTYTAETTSLNVPAVSQNALEFSKSMRNQRESKWIRMLEVDTQGLLDCLHNLKNADNEGILAHRHDIDDLTEGGLVFYFTVVGNNSRGINNYGVRLRNGADLASSDSSAPEIKGLTVVTDQALYIQGDYNKDDNSGNDWRPASVIADSLNVLSNNWGDGNSNKGLDHRTASSTEINTAFMAKTDYTGGIEGADGRNRGNYNGGLENYPRFHEKWSGQSLTYKGSFVSLGKPKHVDGKWEDQSYGAPIRNWSYDERFKRPRLVTSSEPKVCLPASRAVCA